MRVVSLLPSATEILFALGLNHEIVGISHECDFPPQARARRVVIQSRIPHDATPLEIDTQVREYVKRGESLYAVDAQALEELNPDLIVTQDLCHVCAASPDDLATAISRFRQAPEVLCLNPQNLEGVWSDIKKVGEKTHSGKNAEALIAKIKTHLNEIATAVNHQLKSGAVRPKVAFLEWLQPFYVGGHWIPEMLALAGAEDLFGKPAQPTFRVTEEQIIAAAPEIILISPCGYTAQQALQEYLAMPHSTEWNAIPAVRQNRVYALEANSYFSRPGPRLDTGVEILAKLAHPAITASTEAQSAILPIANVATQNQAVTAKP
ncbi:MAG TPA: cobalamin-binding protein [Candidatus Acidoferrum sp.]|jgi:iron complex transport system substrate-binding protein